MDMESRMNGYDDVFRATLIRRMPAVIRVDGRAFHTLTRNLKRPFDERFSGWIDDVAKELLGEIQNSRFAYCQSDEVSVLMIDYDKLNSDAWFGGDIQKIVSISASLASQSFLLSSQKRGLFDSRVFNVPERDVGNYFLWRQRDATRNSIQMVARTLYSHNQLLKKNTAEMMEMMFTKGVNWNDYPSYFKRGRVIYKTANGYVTDSDIPIFSESPGYLQNFMSVAQE